MRKSLIVATFLISLSLILGDYSIKADQVTGPSVSVPTQTIQGKVIDAKSHYQTTSFGDTIIVTDVTVRTGTGINGTSQVRFIGGTVGDVRMTASHTPRIPVRGENIRAIVHQYEGALHVISSPSRPGLTILN